MVSFSDGLPNKGRGIPYFYLTTLDPTARNALKDERASFTASEFPLGTCGKIDPENPTCAKITLIGKVQEKMNTIESGCTAYVTLTSKSYFFWSFLCNFHYVVKLYNSVFICIPR